MREQLEETLKPVLFCTTHRRHWSLSCFVWHADILVTWQSGESSCQRWVVSKTWTSSSVRRSGGVCVQWVPVSVPFCLTSGDNYPTSLLLFGLVPAITPRLPMFHLFLLEMTVICPYSIFLLEMTVIQPAACCLVLSQKSPPGFCSLQPMQQYYSVCAIGADSWCANEQVVNLVCV